MKKGLIIICVLFGLTLFAQEKNEPNFKSFWEGDLKVNSITLKLVIKLYEKDDKSFGGFLDSPNQGATNIPASFVKLTDDSLIVRVDAIAGKYEGKIQKENLTAVGNWSQGGRIFPLELKKTEKAFELKRPQMPIKPYPYNEEEVEFINEKENFTLAGSFTYPKNGSNFPAVIMITGSGRQDRDETLFGHKPFLVIADYLTRNGIAVLRYDDRGAGKSKGIFQGATSEDFAYDALAAIKYLKTRKEVNQKAIGIIGHSEGGLIAPMVANISDDVNFIIMLAGPGARGKELLVLQEELLLKANGLAEDEVAKQVKSSAEAYDIVLNEPDSLKAYKLLKEMYEKEIASLSEEERNKPEYSKENFEQGVRQILSTWFRFFIKYDPRPALENLTIPVLALNGDKDLQVPSKQNLPIIKDALKSAGNKNYKIVELPGLNHAFQHANTGAVTEYSQIEETFSEEALKIIVDWIKEITK
ncbi:MAG: alpha/beta fold hydrolase [Ignavibacteriales bacterium]